MVKLYGFTLQEWGIIIQQQGREPQSLSEAEGWAEGWRKNRPRPGSVRIIGGDYSANLPGATRLWRAAAEQGLIPSAQRR